MRKPKVHFRNLRLFVNAGMYFPDCIANAKLLNTNVNVPVTYNVSKVTCKHCIRIQTKEFNRIMGRK